MIVSVFSFVFFNPSEASAGFFSGMLESVFSGEKVQAEEVESTKVIKNSQTIPLLESTINPDMKNNKEIQSFSIVEDQSLSSNNNPLSPDYDLSEKASTEKIDIYIVKQGDTLKSIAAKFKTTEQSLISFNDDIKKSDLTKVGQALVVLPVKIAEDIAREKKQIEEDKKKEEEEKKARLKAELEKKKQALEKSKEKIVKKEEVPEEKVIVQKEEEKIEKTETVVEKTSGVKHGYIWPFPRGTGVISQELHDDQAYDIAAPKGTPIYAISDGKVLIARPSGYNGGYGLYVVINFDDGRQAILAHMSRVVSNSGDVVKQGDIIGYVGSTGKSTGPHVHIGFRGTLKNPYIGLKKGTRL